MSNRPAIELKFAESDTVNKFLSTWLDLVSKPCAVFDPETGRARFQPISRKNFKIEHFPRGIVRVTRSDESNTMFMKFFRSARAARAYIREAIAVSDYYLDAIDGAKNAKFWEPSEGHALTMKVLDSPVTGPVEFTVSLPEPSAHIDMGGICNA